MIRRVLGLFIAIALLNTTTASGQLSNGPADRPRLDVAFLLDATGSMGDEIDAVKVKIREMISEIALGEPAPDVRFGIVAYRDRGDDYVTRMYELTRDIDEIVENLDEISAAGGGDYAESFNEGLHVVVQDLNWERKATVAKLVFLVADAPPHLDYAQDFDYEDEITIAQASGIAIHAIGASGLDEQGEEIFRQVAEETEGQFRWLAYETQYVDEDGEEIMVVVEGRTTTYSRGGEIWVVEEGGALPDDLPDVGLGRGFEEVATTGAGVGGGGPDGSEGTLDAVSASTNLDELITDAIRDAAVTEGVDYEGAETAIESTSWGKLKARNLGR